MKRPFDLLVSALGLLVLIPVLLLLAIVIRVRLGQPVFFLQERPGLRGRPFTIIKFRTMSEATDDSGNPLSDSDRLTSLGKFLRSSSLDELPELWNVLIGNMSLVGPRPLLSQYMELYSERQMRRHEVRPGITGWAQINGRNEAPWAERLEMDVWYVENRSFALDLKIIGRTMVNVLTRKDVNQSGQATVEYFEGNK